MKAAVLKRSGNLVLEDVPKPLPTNSYVLVRVRACGICGSDLRYFHGENPWALHTLGREIPNPPNMILGHEFAGDVVDAADPKYEYLIGRRVGILAFETCGTCVFCRTGRHNLCPNTRHIGHGAGWGKMEYYPGGMAEYCQVAATCCYELEDAISYEEAALADVLGVGVHATKIAGIRPGGSVLVYGTGPVGLSILQAAKIWGAARVFCADIYPKTLEIAEILGADEIIDARGEDVISYVMRKTGGYGIDAIFDSVGTAGSFDLTLKMLATGGTLVNLVAGPDEVSLRLVNLSGERTIKSSSNSNIEDYQLTLNLLASGRLRAEQMITHRLPLEEVNRAFEILEHKEEYGAVKVMIIP
ncbi:MAG: zinc-dependent alcohol dehydrogenase [bacterium]